MADRTAAQVTPADAFTSGLFAGWIRAGTPGRRYGRRRVHAGGCDIGAGNEPSCD